MRPRSKHPPRTPAERQAKRRAVKRGEWQASLAAAVERRSELPPPPAAPAAAQLPAPVATPTPLALPAPPAFPVPRALPTTAIQRASAGGAEGAGDASRLCLPAAVAARLQLLLDRHHAGNKPLTPAERAEAQGLLDIAEFFVVQRLRQRLAA